MERCYLAMYFPKLFAYICRGSARRDSEEKRMSRLRMDISLSYEGGSTDVLSQWSCRPSVKDGSRSVISGVRDLDPGDQIRDPFLEFFHLIYMLFKCIKNTTKKHFISIQDYIQNTVFT